jgi:hypothetical protein
VIFMSKEDCRCGVPPVFHDSVYRAITKDLSGREGELVEGVFLHAMPVLLLTEYQSERFYWKELQSMISATVYLNNKKMKLNLSIVHPYPNRLYIALTDNKNISGLYLPIGTGTHELRVEWHLRLEGQPYERVTHTQNIVIEPVASTSDERGALTIYSVPEASYGYEHSPMNLKTHAGTQLSVAKQRAELFGTSVKRGAGRVKFSERLILSRALDLSSAAFFTPMLHRLNRFGEHQYV